MRNGYVIYPDSIGQMNLEKAKEYALQRSIAEPLEKFRVEDCDTQRTLATYKNGREVQI